MPLLFHFVLFDIFGLKAYKLKRGCLTRPFTEGATQKGQSKEHCMCIKQNKNISSQSFLRNLWCFYTTIRYLYWGFRPVVLGFGIHPPQLASSKVRPDKPLLVAWKGGIKYIQGQASTGNSFFKWYAKILQRRGKFIAFKEIYSMMWHMQQSYSQTLQVFFIHCSVKIFLFLTSTSS